MTRPFALLPLLLLIVACGTRVRALANVHAAEYAVYAAVLGDLTHEVRVDDQTHEAWSCEVSPVSLCDPRQPPGEFADAWRDYVAKGSAPWLLPRTPTPARPLPQWKISQGADARCWPMPTASLSRVGFNADTTRAVMSYSESTGPGPFPGCGYVGGKLLLLRRDGRGEWQATVVAEWIT